LRIAGDANKLVIDRSRRCLHPKGRVRRLRGNKLTRDIKEMILGALSAGGGQKWLEEQMKANPVAFMTLLGKILPMQLTGSASEEIKISLVNYAG
jgi:hypothetical protein